MASAPTMSTSAIAMTSPVHFLTDQQRLFVENLIKGNPPAVSARIAGYASPQIQAHQLISNPKIKAALAYLFKKHEKSVDMTRKKVMDGLLESIEMAKLQADAGNMVAGWREIAKMCGYYAPEVKKIEISVTAQRVIGQLEKLSDEDLLQMVEESAQVIEGEASRLLEEIQNGASEADVRAEDTTPE